MFELEVNKEVATISSREVAEMIGMDHSKVIRKIDGLNEIFNQANIGFDEYWTESSYKDKKGEMRKCYLVTKKGCEFLGHKLTSEKGVIFTHKYMERFEELENENKKLKEAIGEKDRLLLSLFSSNPVEVANAHKQLLEMETKPLIETIEIQKPKVNFANAILGSSTSISVGEMAKIMKQNGIDIGQNRLFEWLRENEYISKRDNIPTQRSMNLKVMEIKESAYTDSYGEIHIKRTPRITSKGQEYFLKKMIKLQEERVVTPLQDRINKIGEILQRSVIEVLNKSNGALH